MDGEGAESTGLKAEAPGATSSRRILSAVTSEETFSSDPDAGRSERRGRRSIKGAGLLDGSQQPPGS